MKKMEIIETDSIIMIKNAPIEFIGVIKELPWKLFWWEGYLSDGIFGAPFVPCDYDQVVGLVDKPIEEFIDVEELKKDEDANIIFDLYFC